MAVEAGKRITARHVKELEKKNIATLEVPDEYLVGRILSHDVIDPATGDYLSSIALDKNASDFAVHPIEDRLYVPLGYDVQDRKLVVNDAEAASVRRIFERFVELGSATVLARELRRDGFRNKQGTLIDKGYLYRLLNNRVYRGEAVHKGKAYPGEHDAIIDEDLWDRAHSILQESPRKRANNSRSRTPALLKGLIFSDTGAAMTPTSTKKGAKLYRYYVSMDVIRNRETGEETAPMRLAAGMVEDAVVTEVRRILQTPEVVAQVMAALKKEKGAVSEADAIAALHEFTALWAQLFPAEQARIIQLLVRRVTVTAAGLEVDIRREGIAGLVREMVAPRRMEAAE